MTEIKKLYISIGFCLVLILVAYLINIRTINEKGKSTNTTESVSFSVNYPNCADLISQGAISTGTICQYNGTKTIQSFSDLQVWNFANQQWVNVEGIGNPYVIKYLKSGSDQYNPTLPILIRCTWGCTLGFTD